MFHKKDDNKKIEFKNINSLDTIVVTLIYNFLKNYDGFFFDIKDDIDKEKLHNTIVKFTKHHTFESVNIMLGVEQLSYNDLKSIAKDLNNDL